MFLITHVLSVGGLRVKLCLLMHLDTLWYLMVQLPFHVIKVLCYIVVLVFCVTEILLGRKQNSLAAQAMHELGNIHYHSGNIR